MWLHLILLGFDECENIRHTRLFWLTRLQKHTHTSIALGCSQFSGVNVQTYTCTRWCEDRVKQTHPNAHIQAHLLTQTCTPTAFIACTRTNNTSPSSHRLQKHTQTSRRAIFIHKYPIYILIMPVGWVCLVEIVVMQTAVRHPGVKCLFSRWYW